MYVQRVGKGLIRTSRSKGRDTTEKYGANGELTSAALHGCFKFTGTTGKGASGNRNGTGTHIGNN